MSSPGQELGVSQLREIFQALSDRLETLGERAQIFLVGGAAMALAYDRQRLTRDVDAVFSPAPLIRKIAEELSETFGLQPDWINDAAKGFMPGDEHDPRTVFESSALLIQVPSPEYLLAMKLHAARDEGDLRDAVTLFVSAGYSSAAESLALLERTYSSSLLLPRHRYIAAEVAARAAGLSLRSETPE